MGDRSIVIYVHAIDCIRNFGWFFHREKGKGGGQRERERDLKNAKNVNCVSRHQRPPFTDTDLINLTTLRCS